MEVAASLLDHSRDGVWLVELAAVSSEDAVASTITDALGITSRTGQTALETLLGALSPQHVLIVLDNCEHLIEACAKVADSVLRHCPHVRVLATSREPLGIAGESIYRVPSLSMPAGDDDVGPAELERWDAVALFVNRAGAQGVNLVLAEETKAPIISICRRLDGMPLAIELAAARLRSMSVSDLFHRLDQRFRLLTGGSRNALPRQQTLQATVQWSYSLLNEPEQTVLRRLSVFVEGFDLAAAEAVCGLDDIDEFDIAGMVGSLVDKSLVVAEQAAGTTRYRQLETIRQFAAERLVERPGEAAQVAAAHLRHFLAVAEQGAPHLTRSEQGEWFSRFDSDQANFRRAMEHAAAEPDGPESVFRFAIALRRYWWERRRHSDVTEILVPVLEGQSRDASSVLRGQSLVTAALINRTVDMRLARRLAEQALEMARELDDDRLFIEAHWVGCAVSYFFGDAVWGLPLGEAAVERARLFGDDVSLCESLATLLLWKRYMDPVGRPALFSEAVSLAQKTGDHTLTHLLENNAAVFELEVGDITSAREHLERASRAGSAIGRVDESVMINLGWVLREHGATDDAHAKFDDILRICRRNGNRSGVAYAVLGLACLAADRGDWLRAARLHGATEELFDRLGQPYEDLEARYRQSSIERVREHLGDERFHRAYGEGRGLSFDATFDLALGRAQPG